MGTMSLDLLTRVHYYTTQLTREVTRLYYYYTTAIVVVTSHYRAHYTTTHYTTQFIKFIIVLLAHYTKFTM